MERHFERVWTLTQNVDGFHQQAGARNVIDIHGDLRALVCTGGACGYTERVETFAHLDVPPHCPRCGRVIRPDVVLFGEMLHPRKLTDLIGELRTGFDVVFSVGTSSLFPYIRLPVEAAREARIPTVEINPGETELSDLVDLRIQAGAAESLERLWEHYLSGRR
jgi:NAD-dependent deacetylase